MGYMHPDPYGEPEKFGLTMVGDFDMSSGSYEFDLFVVWVDGEGRYWWAGDSGCSCPSPFEMHTDLSMLSSGTAHEAVAAIQQALDARPDFDKGSGYGDAEAAGLIGRIMAAPARV